MAYAATISEGAASLDLRITHPTGNAQPTPKPFYGPKIGDFPYASRLSC
jgi:hypothetical protein